MGGLLPNKLVLDDANRLALEPNRLFVGVAAEPNMLVPDVLGVEPKTLVAEDVVLPANPKTLLVVAVGVPKTVLEPKANDPPPKIDLFASDAPPVVVCGGFREKVNVLKAFGAPSVVGG